MGHGNQRSGAATMNTAKPGIEPPITVFSPSQSDYTATSIIDPQLISPLPSRVPLRDLPVSHDLLTSEPGERPEVLSATPDLPGLLRALRRRWKLAVIGSLICS